MTSSKYCFAVLLACLPVASSNAMPIIFDLENQAQSGFNGGVLQSLVLTASTLSITITRPGTPSRFDIYDVNDIQNPSFPADWGVRSISPWFSNAGTAFVATFDRPVKAFSIDMGDFGGDPDTLFLEAYSGVNATGSLLASTTTMLPQGGSLFTEASLSVALDQPLIQSVRFRGGTEQFSTPFGTFSIPNSVYYDNISVVIPEPASLSLLAGAGMLALRRRRA